MRLLHVVSHPIQYFTPLYKEMAADPEMDFTVLFCSRHGAEESLDPQFGVSIKWDIPLLDGYRHRFLKNHARRESIEGFFGLVNFGIVRELWAAPRGTAVWVHGWGYATAVMAVIFGKLFGHRILLRGENTLVIEAAKPDGLKKRVNQFWLRRVLFKCVDAFLAVGRQNTAYFEMMSVEPSRIFQAPYCIDNRRFTSFFEENRSRRAEIRAELGIPEGKRVIVCSGKFIEKKRPLDLLRAVERLPNRAEVFTVFVGEGELRGEMEAFIKENRMGAEVMLTGFVNQSEMPKYYLAADLYAMCSGIWETWGLSTNEAMCFGLPVVLSDMVGSAHDLIDGNGFMFKTGDVGELSERIQQILSLPTADFEKMQSRSREIIQHYSYERVAAAIKTASVSQLTRTQ